MESEENSMSEISIEDFVNEKKSFDFRGVFESYKYSLITAIYYSLGLTVGSKLYKTFDSDIFNRLTTIENCDHIFCVEGGKIVKQR